MRKGVLIVNIGSPSEPTKYSVKKYLREFLMDKNVLSMPYFLRWVLVNIIIVPFRAAASMRRYKSIWLPQGAPLKVISGQLVSEIKKNIPDTVAIELAMRYGSPSIDSALDKLADQKVSQVLLLPMYPHYTKSTYYSSLEKVRVALESRYPDMVLNVIPPYFDHPDYIHTLAHSIKEQLQHVTNIDKLLFTFHNIPLSHLPCNKECAATCNATPWAGCINPQGVLYGCYKYECYKTVEDTTEELAADPHNIEIAFQSKMGKGKWLSPELEQVIERLKEEKVNHLAIVSPSFTADCSETYIDLDLLAKDQFLQDNSPAKLTRLLCLNTDSMWIRKLSKWVTEWSNKA